jgi:hypothetical protein
MAAAAESIAARPRILMNCILICRAETLNSLDDDEVVEKCSLDEMLLCYENSQMSGKCMSFILFETRDSARKSFLLPSTGYSRRCSLLQVARELRHPPRKAWSVEIYLCQVSSAFRALY